MKTPTVSVVIPMYNVERYIATSLASVLAQTFADFEVICVDDGCKDQTIAKLNQFKDSRIRLVKQENRGLSGARNTGINAARGKYVALLDADDYWAPQKLALHVRHLESDKSVGISYSPSWFVNEEGQHMGIGQFPKLSNITAKDVFCRNPIGNGSAPVIRKELLRELAQTSTDAFGTRATYFNETLRQSEDIEFWLRVALNGQWKIAGINQPLTFYRVNSSGLSANLEKQFASWQRAVVMNMDGNHAFFDKWYSLAQAYQYRYLARRAVQSGNSHAALRLVANALRSNPRILQEEPVRTLVTFGCALLAQLPNSVFKKIESAAMALVGRKVQA